MPKNDDCCTVRAGKKFRPNSGELRTVLPNKVKTAELPPDQKLKTENNK